MDQSKGWVLGGVAFGIGAVGLFYSRSRNRKTAEQLERAASVNLTSLDASVRGEVYALVRGKVEPVQGKWLVAEFSQEKTVASMTHLKRRWSERTVNIRRGQGKERDSVEYGDWEQKSELVGEPVSRTVPSVVLHTQQGGPMFSGQVVVAVSLDCEAKDLPLAMRYSRSMEENKSGGTSVVINNSNNSGQGTVQSGSKESREMGTLREEFVLPCDGRPLTVFGAVHANAMNELVVQRPSGGSLTPWIATFDSPQSVIAGYEVYSNRLWWGGLICTIISGGLISYATFLVISEGH